MKSFKETEIGTVKRSFHFSVRTCHLPHCKNKIVFTMHELGII